MSERVEGDLRVLLAAGSRELEGRLTRELPAAAIVIGGRCLDGPSLLERAAEPELDAVLAAANLHRLSEETLRAVAERLPIVLLAGPGDDLAQLSELACVVPAGAPTAVVAAALHQAGRSGTRRAGSGRCRRAAVHRRTITRRRTPPPRPERQAGRSRRRPRERQGRPGQDDARDRAGRAVRRGWLAGGASRCGPARRQRRALPGSRSPARAGRAAGGGCPARR